METLLILIALAVLALLVLIYLKISKIENHLAKDASNAYMTDWDEPDELFGKAAEVIAQYDRASASLIQRRLSIGYARAARILDQLCSEGLISEADGAKPRKVYKDKIKEYLKSKES